jgi:aryl-alcohol dehydrogenase-like predicted oxidoreductase
MQNRYSLLYREEEREMNAYCKFAGIGLLPFSVLCYGLLARPLAQDTARGESYKGSQLEYKLQDWSEEIIARVEKLAKEKGWTMSQVALAWTNEQATSPLIGISSVRAVGRT